MLYGRIQDVKARIEKACAGAGRSPSEVRLIAVTKGVTGEAVREAYDNGLRAFGENYLQEARQKIQALPGDITWHFIGRLQRNKAKDVVKTFDVIHSVDSLRLAEEVATRARDKGFVQKIFLQVNIAGEATKSGCSKDDAPALMEAMALIEGLDIRGLMCIPPISDDPEASRPWFRGLRELRDTIAGKLRKPPGSLGLSMGMSADFEVAVQEGATDVRIGTAIFGPRN